jgi:ubiquinone/menaquinone biosynthesis C-methylase UbiE
MEPARTLYEGPMAAAYEPGRSLLPEAEDAWAASVAPLVPQGALVVDVGAGTGRFARLFATRFASRVIAVEPAAGMRSAAPEADVTWTAGAAEALPLASGCADVAWLSCVVHYLDLDATGRELARIVGRDGAGRVLVRSTFPDRFDELEWIKWFPTARAIDEERMPTVDQLAAAWSPHGLQLEARIPSSQIVARDLHDLIARLEHRAISTLTLMTDEEFAAGLTALRAHAKSAPPHPTHSAMDILTFTPTAE